MRDSTRSSDSSGALLLLCRPPLHLRDEPACTSACSAATASPALATQVQNTALTASSASKSTARMLCSQFQHHRLQHR
jgi:hypothetical protein